MTCTDYNRRYIADLPGVDVQNVIVIHHGVDVARFMSLPHRPVSHRILTVGRLIPRRGIARGRRRSRCCRHEVSFSSGV